MEADALTPMEQALLGQIKARKARLVSDHRRKKSAANNQAVVPRRMDKDRTSTTTHLRVRCLVLDPCSYGWAG